MSLVTATTLLILAVSLSVDTFAAALTKGATVKRLKRREKRRIAAIFTACAMVAPALGWSVGYLLSNIITQIDHWIAFALLAGVGMHMVYNGFHHNPEHPGKNLKPLQIFITAIATNIDAVAVGIGLAFTDLNIFYACLAVGIVTVIATYLGLHLGKRSGKLLGHRAEIIGGLVLIALGIKVLLQHVMA